MAQANPKDVSLEKQLPHKEVRFAVVMYGGVSLAIYIHGVAHELLSVVRATARDKKSGEYIIPDQQLKGAELVYRSLGEALKAKFIVDILSGTSAGGINAVYLAKALVNDKSMDGLKELWVQEGDISKLINDNQSVEGLGGLGLQDPPEALLNSQRMYFKLLEALKRMGSSGDTTPSPYVEQLDLNITATDIRGLNLPIKIRNNSINELRFRTVFKFQYSTGTTFKNDFTKGKDPFLAFAARCTSSIPPAFEAMRLKDIEDVLKTSMFKEDYGDLLKSGVEPWQSFYEEYVGVGDMFSIRSFGDGGYLDNKPFSYATETLQNRRADLPVDRKLIYIEPSPEHPEMRLASDARPNMIENVSAALVGLPRQETIRDDLKSILERNENIGRANKILAEVNDVFHKIVSREGSKGKSKFQEEFDNWKGAKADWPGKYLDEVIDDYGAHYPSYHQLRVEDTLDSLASIFACGMGWDGSGQQAKDLRVLLNAWRDEFYGTTTNDAAKNPNIHSENEILSRLDIRWRQRRIYFIQTLANLLLDGLDGNDAQTHEQAQSLFKLSGVDGSDYDNCPDQYRLSIQELKEKFNLITAEFDHAINMLSDDSVLGAARSGDANAEPSYSSRLKELRNALTETPREALIPEANLRRMAELLRNRNPQARSIVLPTLKKIEDLTVDLSPHYEPAGTVAPAATPDALPKTYFIKDSLRTLAIASANTFGEEGRGAVKQIDQYFNVAHENIDTTIHGKVQQCLKFFHDRFEYYDMLLFPLQFGTNFGESDEVEIIRISPEDATRFIDERQTGKKKLAGTKLSNFGAFFRKEWRENDMLWGRLDAAEILLNELLAGESEQTVAELRAVLSKRMAATGYSNGSSGDARDPYDAAFELILQEDLKPKIEVQLYNLVNGKPALTPRGNKAARSAKTETTSPRLEELKNQEARLARLQEDLESYLLEKEDPNLRQRVDQFKAERQTLNAQINAERARLKQPSAAPAEASSLSKTSMEQYQELSRSMADGPHLLHYFKYGYQVDTSFEPESTVLVVDRFVQTLSRMLNGLSENRSVEKPIRAFTFLMRIVSSVVAFALPKSISNYLFSGYWIWILYAAEAIIWLAGILTANQNLAGIGWKTLLATGVVHLAVSGLNRWIFPAGKRKYAVSVLSWILLILLALLLGSVFYSGLVYLHILPAPAGVFQNLLLWIQSLFQNKAG